MSPCLSRSSAFDAGSSRGEETALLWVEQDYERGILREEEKLGSDEKQGDTDRIQ
jgi:hypothetical protein